jgi:N6-adenosine-specific RNA methylase IME4
MRLQTWASQNGLRHLDMARRFGISESMVGKLCSGSRQPSLKLIRQIDREPEGAVSLRDWYAVAEPRGEAPGFAVANFEELPHHHFGAIYADPPWYFRTRSDKGRGRSPDKHYACMSMDDLKALPIGTVALPDCHLFMWTPAAHIPDALALMDAWGFSYSSTFVIWVKLKKGTDLRRLSGWTDADLAHGLGMTTRKGVEVCLLGRRGAPKRMSKAIREVIVAPVGRHSRKPVEARARVEGYAEGPYLELFARQVAPGWVAWGDQLEGEHAAASNAGEAREA